MGILFVPYPARGHVGPFLAVAADLVRCGVAVRMVLPRRYVPAAMACGVDAVLAGTDRGARVPAGWGRQALGSRWVARGVRRRSAEEIRDAVRRELITRPPALVVLDPHARWARSLAGDHAAAWLWTTSPRRSTEGAPLLVNGIPGLVGGRGRAARVRFLGPLLGESSTGDRTERPAGRRIAVVSFGTVFARRPGWLAELAEAFRGTDWVVALSTGEVPVAALGRLPDNVVASESIPQRELLDRAAVFLTHGGMNSVLEAAWAGVPMLLDPISREQAGNAARVVRLRAGLMLGPLTGLRRQLDEVTGGRTIQAGLADLRDAVRSAPSVAEAGRQLLRLADFDRMRGVRHGR